MDSCLILRATLFGILLLGLLTPAQTKAGYLGSVKRGSQGIKIRGYLGNYRGMKKQGCDSVKRENNDLIRRLAALERKDHLGGQDLQALKPKDDVGSLVPQANRQGRTGAKIGPGLFGTERPTSYF